MQNLSVSILKWCCSIRNCT